jgi:prepilin-type N-terminal cleavage/methylation domain-containing protein
MTRLRAAQPRPVPAGAASGGFTMIEIMMAIVVFLTAAAGMVAFEHAVMRSNSSANDITSATYIGEFWLERGRVESLLWNRDATDLTLARAPLLASVGTNVAAANYSTGWQYLPALGTRAAAAPVNRYLETWPGATGAARDYAEYCVQYRLTVLMPNELMRMEVRVVWFKQGAGVSRAAAGGTAWTCDTVAASMLLAGEPDRRNVNVVQLATTLWRNQVQR